MAESKVFQHKDYQNIIDYVYQQGDRTFEEESFGDLDNAVLSAFSYIPFEKFEKTNKEFQAKTIRDVCLDYLSWVNLDYIADHYPDWLRKSIFLAMALFHARRYQNCLITDFDYEFSFEESTQFGALNIFLDNHTSAVVYRGTDNSILGWKEDFDLACYESVKGQQLAKSFLKKMMDRYPEKHFYVMGHSKGGNLAVYACCFLSKAKIDRILRIYSDDGPGMNEKVFYSMGHARIEDKITHIMVKDDMVGRLLCHEKAEYVVLSSPKNDIVMQHDLFNWHIENNSFVKVDRISPESYYLTNCINDWLMNSMPDEKTRIRLVTAIFDAQGKTDFEEVGKILDNPKKFILDFLRELKGIDKDDKKLMTKAFMSFVMTLVKNHPAYLKDKNEYSRKDEKENTNLLEVKANG